MMETPNSFQASPRPTPFLLQLLIYTYIYCLYRVPSSTDSAVILLCWAETEGVATSYSMPISYEHYVSPLPPKVFSSSPDASSESLVATSWHLCEQVYAAWSIPVEIGRDGGPYVHSCPNNQYVSLAEDEKGFHKWARSHLVVAQIRGCAQNIQRFICVVHAMMQLSHKDQHRCSHILFAKAGGAIIYDVTQAHTLEDFRRSLAAYLTLPSVYVRVALFILISLKFSWCTQLLIDLRETFGDHSRLSVG